MTFTLELLAFGGLCVGWGMVCLFSFERGRTAERLSLRAWVFTEIGSANTFLKSEVARLEQALMSSEIDKLSIKSGLPTYSGYEPISLSLSAEEILDGHLKATPKKHKKAGGK